jgi:hypothetical protein
LCSKNFGLGSIPNIKKKKRKEEKSSKLISEPKELEWHMYLISATQEAEIGGLGFEASMGEKS